MLSNLFLIFFFFFNDTATTEIYPTVHTLSLHDALPIFERVDERKQRRCVTTVRRPVRRLEEHTSELQSRTVLSYAVFCLKKKKSISSPVAVLFFHHKKNNKRKNKNIST